MKNLANRMNYKDLIGKSGVYRITCGIYSYIGSSKNIYVRLKNHHNKLRKGNHYNIFLQRLYNKHGESLFYYDILELCENYVEREEFFIKNLKPQVNVEQEPLNRTKSQSTKDKIGKIMLGKFPGGKNPAAKPVYQYKLTGEFIHRYSCATEAAKAISGNAAGISQAATKKIKSSGGFIWRFTKSSKVASRKKSNRPSKYKLIKTIDSNGKEKTWKSVIKLADYLGVTFHTIYKASKNESICKGFKIKLEL